jgi:hypothetical protein
MSLILSIALFAQDVPQNVMLTTDSHQAALTCVAAMAAVKDNKPVPFRAAVASHLLVQAALANPKPAGFFARLESIGAESAAVPKLAEAEANALFPLCLARYPQARRDGPVTLPADPLERDVTCMGALSIMAGSAESMKAEGQAELLRLSPAIGIYSSRMNLGLTAKGFANETAAEPFIGQVVTASLRLGNPYILSNACIAALPPG